MNIEINKLIISMQEPPMHNENRYLSMSLILASLLRNIATVHKIKFLYFIIILYI